MAAPPRPIVVALVLLLASPLAAAPPVPPALLLALERDLGGALAQLEILRDSPATAGGGETPARLLGIADGTAQARMAALETTVRTIRRRLYALDAAVRELGDPRLARILFVMNREVDRLVAALARAGRARDGELRRRSLARVERALVQLDGATAAFWTFD